MRNAAKGWVAKVLIGLLVISFAVWGVTDVFTGYRAGALVTVGGQEVSANQFNEAFNRMLRDMSQQSGNAMTPDEARKIGLDRTVLNSLIQQAALDDQAESLKLSISDAKVAGQIAENKAFQGLDGKFDPAALRNYLQRAGLAESALIANERAVSLRSAISNAVGAGLAPPKTMVEALTQFGAEERDARYFAISVADADVAPPSEDDIKKQYESSPDAYTAPEYRSLAILSAEPVDIAPKLTVTEEELKAGYEKYKADFFTPETRTILQITFNTEEEAAAAKTKIDGGADFMAIAKERGATEADITLAKRKKTDLLDPAIADAAFSLALNQVSAPVKGTLATALLKVTEIVPEKQASLEESRDVLKSRLQQERAREEADSLYDAVENDRNNQMKFEDIAAKHGVPLKIVPAISRSGEDKDGKNVELAHKNEVLQAAFDSDVGVENQTLTIDQGYTWFEVREVIPSALRPLESVKDKVKADIIARRLREAAAEKAKAIVTRAQSGIAFETLAQEEGQPVREANGLKRNETSAEFDSSAVAALFGVPQNGVTWALDGDGRSAKIIQSKAVMAPPFDPASPAAKQASEAILNGLETDIPQLYLGALQGNKGVALNEAVWKQLSGGSQTQ
jgi:peptidyl-prolyl cis-trans isomerase D